MVHTLGRMDQFERTIAKCVLREMSTAGVDLDELSANTGITKPTLVRRLGQGSFKVRELGIIANALGCDLTELLSVDQGAAS